MLDLGGSPVKHVTGALAMVAENGVNEDQKARI